MERDKVFAEALRLPTPARADLAAKLLRSLDDEEEGLTREEWEAAWTHEISRRVREVHDGLVGLVDGDAALQAVRGRVRSRP